MRKNSITGRSLAGMVTLALAAGALSGCWGKGDDDCENNSSAVVQVFEKPGGGSGGKGRSKSKKKTKKHKVGSSEDCD